MFRSSKIANRSILGGGLALAMLVPLGSASAKSGEIVLYSFTGGADGSNPYAGLIADKAGNLYGTTGAGGVDGYGAVFKLAPDGTETVLHSFSGGNDGDGPHAGLIADKKGNLYGTTYGGGADGYGTVFKLAPDGTETVLHSFKGGGDGVNPFAGLIMGSSGDLYGTTEYGGGSNNCNSGCGIAFKVTLHGKETVLHAFSGGADGANPLGGVITDSSGNLYGTTELGGIGVGTAYRLAPDGTENVLYTFTGAADGGMPWASLIMDSAGNLYGTTYFGGAYGWGTVFRVAPNGTEIALYSFCSQGYPCADGRNPAASLIIDKLGNLYSSTVSGGANDYGTVFMLAADGTETVLHSFTEGRDGAAPYAGLISDKNGNLYGTTFIGGAYSSGNVFKINK